MSDTKKIFRNYLPEVLYLKITRRIPNAVTVNLTDLCNQNCIYCEIGIGIKTEKKDRLDLEDLKWIIDEMYLLKIKRLALCGGEPLLFNGLYDIIEYAGNKGIICSITTNGIRIKDITDKEIKILKSNRTQINISCDSFDNIIQNTTRGRNSNVEDIISSVSLLTKNKIPVILLCVISKYNYKNLYEYFCYAFSIGVSQVLFQPVISFSNFPDRSVIPEKGSLNVSIKDIDELMNQLRKILDFENWHRIKTNVYRLIHWLPVYIRSAHENELPFFNNILKKFYCRDVHAIIDITYDGGIQPCGLMPAFKSVKKDRKSGLYSMWMDASGFLKNKLSGMEYPAVCNGCCHHFSRNMIASVIKFPISNFSAFIAFTKMISLRSLFVLRKKILFIS